MVEPLRGEEGLNSSGPLRKQTEKISSYMDEKKEYEPIRCSVEAEGSGGGVYTWIYTNVIYITLERKRRRKNWILSDVKKCEKKVVGNGTSYSYSYKNFIS